MIFHSFQHIPHLSGEKKRVNSWLFFSLQFFKYFEYKIDHISKIGKLSFHRFQNCAHIFLTNNPIWPLLRGGWVCMSLTRNNPLYTNRLWDDTRTGFKNWLFWMQRNIKNKWYVFSTVLLWKLAVHWWMRCKKVQVTVAEGYL